MINEDIGKRYKEINDIITRIASKNSNITSEQIAKARSLYNGDTRPLEEIEAELLAFSEQISLNAREREEGQALKASKREAQDAISQRPETVAGAETQESAEKTTTNLDKEIILPHEIHHIIGQPDHLASNDSILTGEELDNELANMFEGYEPYEAREQQQLEESHAINGSLQFVKRPGEVSTSTTDNSNNHIDNNEGYGSLVAISIVLSFMTIIIVVATLLVK